MTHNEKVKKLEQFIEFLDNPSKYSLQYIRQELGDVGYTAFCKVYTAMVDLKMTRVEAARFAIALDQLETQELENDK